MKEINKKVGVNAIETRRNDGVTHCRLEFNTLSTVITRDRLIEAINRELPAIIFSAVRKERQK